LSIKLRPIESTKFTPTAFANFSPAVGAPATTLGTEHKNASNPERVRLQDKPFQGLVAIFNSPRVLASSNPGLKLANAFGVFIRIQTVRDQIAKIQSRVMDTAKS
jgi:hypothetical protein